MAAGVRAASAIADAADIETSISVVERNNMSNDRNSKANLEDQLFDHCLGEGCPSHVLLNTGAFPPTWVDRYLELLEQATDRWQHEQYWPKCIIQGHMSGK